MATAALLLDKETGASDTLSIVHNITSDAEQGKKRPQQFNKGKASLRGRIYMQYYDYFMLMWLDTHCSPIGHAQGGEAAKKMAAWDLFAGMTKKEAVSDAQKRAQRMPKCQDDSPSRRRRMDNDLEETVGSGKYFFTNSDELPPLTGTGSSDGGSSDGSPSTAGAASERSHVSI
jgi:hypothetical protein